MRKLLLGLSLAWVAMGSAEAACGDTTVIIAASPFNPTTLNSAIQGCTDATMTIRLKFTGDTLRLTNEIVVAGRAGKTTSIIGQNATDSILTLLESNSADPQLLNVNPSNATILSNLGFARKSIGPSNEPGGPVGSVSPSVLIAADSSQVKGCHFWMADNSTTGVGPLLDITSNTVLVERCLFRAPPDGVGRSIAIHTGGTATRTEIRSSVFFSTGLQLAATGTAHVIANTFTGSRTEWNAIVVGSSIVTSPERNIVIQHNLFANKVDIIPPINFASGITASDSILRNAWSRGKANLPLAVSASSGNASITLNGNSGANINTPLPRGFSNYGPSSFNVKDYPLTQLRSDPTLARKHADFGKMFRVFTNSNTWTGMADIKDLPASKLYFPGFTPFIAGKSWLANVRVGAFVDQDTYETPSPLDSGLIGAALKFTPLKSDSTKIVLSQRSFDANYYKTTNLTPEYMWYFFSDSLAKLTSNDTTALTASVKSSGSFRRTYLNEDTLFQVPKEVRLGAEFPFYVKMLHYRQGQQAPVQSQAVIARVLGVPSFPINDLTIKLDTPSTVFGDGLASLRVTRKTEAIDSIRVVVATEGGQDVSTTTKSAGTSGTQITFDITVPKGTFVFYAVPVAKLVTGAIKAGQPTPNTQAATFRTVFSDTVFVELKTGGCTGALGSEALPYCSLDSAMKKISVDKGTTVIIKKINSEVNMEEITLAPFNGTDTTAVTITTTRGTGKYVENRPIFRGNTKAALTITRKNVTLKGFFIEMPIGSSTTALSVRAGGALVEGNIFRAVARGAVEGAAVNIEVGASADMRFVNNLVWGFTKNVQITTPSSASVRVVNNTFVDDVGLTNTGKTIGLTVTGTGSLGAVFANNYFSGISNPVDSSFQGRSPAPVLDRNAYLGKPNLRGFTDIGALDSTGRIQSADVWASNYILVLESALASAIECGISACNPLYAGSSTTTYDVTVSKDILGKSRTNKKDVGSFELNPTSSSVLGILAIEPALSETHTRINWVVTAKTFDPAEAESLFVFWSTTNISSNIETSLGNLPAANLKRIPISELSAGNVSGFFDNIKDEATAHYFYAVLGRTVNGQRRLGYAYSKSITSSVQSEPGDCTISTTKSACPSESGFFIVASGLYAGKFQTRVTFSEPAVSGLVKSPEFISIQDPRIFNLDLTSPLPMIKLNTTVSGLGEPASKQTIKANIEMDALPDLSGYDLFLIPSDSSGLASFVSTWSYKQENGKTSIIIESNIKGNQNYAFGKLQPTMEPGIVLSADASVPVFDFTRHRDSTILHIPIKLKGTGFKTANPLVLVSIIPAGGIIKAVDERIVDVLSGSYHTKTLALSAGFSSLAESLQTDRFYRYLRKAAVYEATSTMGMGHLKPFLLDTNLSLENFKSATGIQVADLSVAAGTLGEISIELPINREFKDFAKYYDQKGKGSRSIEVVYTVFDGSKISRSRSFIQTRFADVDLQFSEKKLRGFESSRPGAQNWNLFGYPWNEADTGSLARVVQKTKWDVDNMRLMKYKGTGSGPSSFNIYTGSNPGDIRYDSGQAAWSGSTAPYQPICFGGASLDFETFKMPLAPNQWNDISLPFNFSIKWADILDSSKIARTAAPPAWRYNPTAKAYEALTAASILNPWEGYTIRPSAPVTLSIPILDTARSTTAIAKVAAKPGADDPSWTARILASNATASVYLRIGKSNRESLFPEAPNVPGQDFRLALKHSRPSGDEKVSEFIQEFGGTWQGHWSLRASLGEGAEGVTLRIGDATRQVPLFLVETLHKTAVPLSADAPIALSGLDLRANDYHLVAGDKDYLDAVMQGLVPLHMLALINAPNPFAGSTLIRYGLPESFGKVSFDLKVRDFRGRTVWQKTIRGGSSLSYLWDGRDRMNSPLPAGVYQLTLEASTPGKPVFKANRRMLRM